MRGAIEERRSGVPARWLGMAPKTCRYISIHPGNGELGRAGPGEPTPAFGYQRLHLVLRRSGGAKALGRRGPTTILQEPNQR